MEQKSMRSATFSFSSTTNNSFLMLMLLIIFSHGLEGASAYTNYTVGDSHGWFDNLRDPKVNYQKWAAGKIFTLGDFLIFNTDKNHSVVQTYNASMYRRCDENDADGDDTVEWSSGEPSATADPVAVPVPLLKEGTTYFFSGYYDGEQCKHGQHFKITVSHGKGLPDSLKPPPVVSPAPVGPDDVPDSTVPSNFDNPNGTSSVTPDSASGGAPPCLKGRGTYYLGVGLLGLLMMVLIR